MQLSKFTPQSRSHSSPARRLLLVLAGFAILITLGVAVQVVFAAPSLVIDKRANLSSVAPGEEVIFTIRYRCASLTENCINATITDTLPSGFQLDSYSAASGLVGSATETNGTITWNLESSGSPGELDAGTTGLLYVRGRFPACDDGMSPATSGLYTNMAGFSADGATQTIVTADFTLSSDVPACPVVSTGGDPGLSKETEWNPGVVPINGYMEHDLTYPSSGTTYTLTDNFPVEFVPNAIAFEAGLTLQIQCADSGNWHTAPGSGTLDTPGELPGAATECTTTASPYVNGEFFFNITDIRYIVPPGISGSIGDAIRGYLPDSNPFTPTSDLPNFSPAIEGQSIVNCLSSSDGAMGTDCSSYDILADGPMANLEKEIAGYPDPTNADGGTNNIMDFPNGIQDSMTNTGNGSNTWPLQSDIEAAFNDTSVFPQRTQGPSDIVFGVEFGVAPQSNEWANPVVVDLLDANLEWAPYPAGNSWWFVIVEDDTNYDPFNPADDPDCSNPTFSYEEDYNGSGRTLLRWDFSGCTLPHGNGDRPQIWIFFNTQLKSGTPGGTNISNMPITAIDDLASTVECRGGNDHNNSTESYWPDDTDLTDFDNNGDTTTLLCKGEVVNFTVPVIADMESAKYVQAISTAVSVASHWSAVRGSLAPASMKCTSITPAIPTSLKSMSLISSRISVTPIFSASSAAEIPNGRLNCPKRSRLKDHRTAEPHGP